MAQPYRLDRGGRIDRSRPLDFTFNGRRYTGYAGDTLASALIANGVHLIGRSFKYHRPRGHLSAGAEEPAVIQLGEGAYTVPDVRATQAELHQDLAANSVHAWPSVNFDLYGLNQYASKLIPAGFYYKTFMWPAKAWHFYEQRIRAAAGLGHAPEEPDPDFYDKRFAHTDVLVAGAGPAGLAAALSASRAGARVILADEQGEMGGSLLSRHHEIDGKPALDWVDDALAELHANPDVRVLPRALVFGYYDHNWVDLLESLTDHLADKPKDVPRQRMWKVRAKHVVIAQGAIERPLVFQDNDRPGTMLASGVQSYINRWAVKPGEKAVVYTNNDSAYDAVMDMRAAGIEIAAVVDCRQNPYGPNTDRARQAGIDILAGHGVIGTEGAKHIRKVKAAPLSPDGTRVDGTPREFDCDLLAMSGGWTPSVHLHSQARGTLHHDPNIGAPVPDTPLQENSSAGACNGTMALKHGLDEGFRKGAEAAERLGFTRPALPDPVAGGTDFHPARWLWITPGTKPVGHGGKHMVDFQNDVTASDLYLALREGFKSIEHVKRYTTCGMATDQGKTSNINALHIVANARGMAPQEVGTTTYRPPYTPVTFGAWAGRDTGEFFDSVRKTPMHPWHEQAGAVFENVGLWKRPWYFPKDGETMEEAVYRECKETRESIGVLDATTLGRIDVQGKDAVTFLNAIYTNGWKTLKPGHCRYGVMCHEDGMVMDDGVTMCLGENHYLVHTTTGGAGGVMSHLEEYLQTEWPHLDVYLTSVTEQYATAAIAGPNARKLMRELADDIDVENDSFPFMTWKEGHVAGMWARVVRVSFSGDISFEINVEAHNGLKLWQTVMTKGQKYNICPYGTETMHVLRAEKGFIIVGQETDGTVTPYDLGMDRLVSSKKDFVGKRGLQRPDILDPNRKQLVAVLPDEPSEVLEEGAQLVETVKDEPPMEMVGNVTSSYLSPNIDPEKPRSFALATVYGGRHKHGQKVYAPMEDKTIPCTLADPFSLYDPEGVRLRG